LKCSMDAHEHLVNARRPMSDALCLIGRTRLERSALPNIPTAFADDTLHVYAARVYRRDVHCLFMRFHQCFNQAFVEFQA
jgi:hypothetical protein